MLVTTDILQSLNDQQRAAVMQTEGPVLVFAGAGSGKTRVLTHRIAYLIKEKGVRPWNILAVTFTNKAAKEMRERIERLAGRGRERPLGGHFPWHLRPNPARAGRGNRHRPQLHHLRRLRPDPARQESMEAEDVDQKIYKPRAILDMISKAKEQLVLPAEFGRRFVGSIERIAERVYRTYQAKLKLNRALDFDDLIMYTVLLFRDQPDVLKHYQDKFSYVLVDEYQDINFSQYTLVHNIAEKHHNIFCVGDDDQSIYRWRGADVGIILQFEKDYPDAAVFKLETQLPLHQEDPRGRARHRPAQRRSRRKEALDRERRGHRHRTHRRLQRDRRGQSRSRARSRTRSASAATATRT